MPEVSVPYIVVVQNKKTILLTRIRADVLAKLCYVAVRGQSNEAGAVQRVLNQRRIASIKEFTLAGGHYPGAIVLNWVSKENFLKKRPGRLAFAEQQDSAQIVDGQHRVAGIRAAIAADKRVGALELCVAIYENLSTQECADIFLSINTEQKPVDRSLVFDLYGVASATLIDPAAERARDIAMFLNDSDESPYKACIKLPGDPRRKGGIALSTVVTAIKPLVEDKGNFDQLGVTELEGQKQILLNLFSALKTKYGDEWTEPTNVFQYAAGFVGAIEFLRLKLIPYCVTKGSFEADTVGRSIKLDSNLLLQKDVRGMAGGEASNQVYKRLLEAFTPGATVKKLRY